MSESGEYHCMMPSAPAVPIADENGNITTGWRAFLRVMQARTGGVPGIATGDVVGTVTDEAAAREAADTALQTAVNTEATARAAGDAAEALARANGDAALNAAKLSTAGGVVSGPLTVLAPVTAAAVVTAGAGGPTWTAGIGAPGSAQPVGSLYSRVDGTVGARLYVSAGGGVWTGVAGV
jgi:hypothetical protein